MSNFCFDAMHFQWQTQTHNNNKIKQKYEENEKLICAAAPFSSSLLYNSGFWQFGGLWNCNCRSDGHASWSVAFGSLHLAQPYHGHCSFSRCHWVRIPILWCASKCGRPVLMEPFTFWWPTCLPAIWCRCYWFLYAIYSSGSKCRNDRFPAIQKMHKWIECNKNQKSKLSKCWLRSLYCLCCHGYRSIWFSLASNSVSDDQFHGRHGLLFFNSCTFTHFHLQAIPKWPKLKKNFYRLWRPSHNGWARVIHASIHVCMHSSIRNIVVDSLPLSIRAAAVLDCDTMRMLPSPHRRPAPENHRTI